MIDICKKYIFQIGVVIFCLTNFLEHLFFYENYETLILKGIGCALIITGFILKILKKKENTEEQVKITPKKK
jgi:hypothetical protein